MLVQETLQHAAYCTSLNKGFSICTKISFHRAKSMSERQRKRGKKEIWSELMRKREWICSNKTSKIIALLAPISVPIAFFPFFAFHLNLLPSDVEKLILCITRLVKGTATS